MNSLQLKCGIDPDLQSSSSPTTSQHHLNSSPVLFGDHFSLKSINKRTDLAPKTRISSLTLAASRLLLRHHSPVFIMNFKARTLKSIRMNRNTEHSDSDEYADACEDPLVYSAESSDDSEWDKWDRRMPVGAENSSNMTEPHNSPTDRVGDDLATEFEAQTKETILTIEEARRKEEAQLTMEELEGNIDAALSDCDQALMLQPDYVKCLERRAILREERDMLTDALHDYEKLLKLDPGNQKARWACMTLPDRIKRQQEEMKEKMLDQLKQLGNLVLKPFGLSTDNFKVEKKPDSEGYSINFVR
ncbi:tetratricopeptide repeat protein 1 [Clonorchis sinensis]|uniref:Tetratricopeptide repeat protein 1 n=1 Tax=Clonorchis sinensis TaxID=79923 RepID=G7YDI2_CLOSI|nr:tetratricopeptide repeat protein 1 [Clonorchis sinensis]